MWVTLSKPPDGQVALTLPMPPDYRFSFSGSALPFPSEAAAFDTTRANTIMTTATGKQVHIPDTVADPNFYYLNGKYSAPRARASYTCGGVPVVEMRTIVGVRRVPGRSLTAASRVLSSTRHGPVLTQETLIRTTAMPSAPCLPRSS